MDLSQEEFESNRKDFDNFREYWYLFRYPNELHDYLRFHNALDRFAWLFRLRYADKKSIQSKRYRIDVLFQSYIHENNISPSKVYRNIGGKKFSKEKFIYFLTQGWYNELAAAYPFVQEPMNLGTSIYNCKENWKVELFPSWYIIKSYYACYAFHNAFVFTNSEDTKTFQHKNTTNYFNNNLFQKYSKNLMFYPFNLTNSSNANVDLLRKVRKKEWGYQYAKYPRDSTKTIYDIETDYISDLERAKLDLKSKYDVSLINILYLFRVWANYLGHETVVKLHSGGLILFLERNLYFINFLIAGLCELLAIGFLGEDEYVNTFKEFFANFIKGKDELYSNWYIVPQIIRLRIYKHLNLISYWPEEIEPPNNDKLILLK